uniref:P53 and DNA damage-regulated protein 1 n=1 Tax=Panagrellus redivivus TaxID=6233 RepID=A0A7E4V174_PANRE
MSDPASSDQASKLKQLEIIEHEILAARQRILELDENRQYLRQAWVAAKTANADPEGQKKTWFVLSPKMFIQFPTSTIEDMMKEKVDETEKAAEEVQDKLEKDIAEFQKHGVKNDLMEEGVELDPLMAPFLVEGE